MENLMMELTDLYNHKNFIKSVEIGDKLVDATDFDKYKSQRLQMIKNFKIGDIIKDNSKKAKIVAIEDDIIIAIPLSWYTRKGKIKKIYTDTNGEFFNPCHVELIKE